MNNNNFKVYWEKQGKNNLCGLHCINSLLQGPVFEKSMLDEISKNLDNIESNLLNLSSNNNENKDTINKYSENNYDYNGNYNIQVIIEALKIFGVELEIKKKEDLFKIINESLENVEAFLLNSSTHWLCLRKINNIWFNLNNTNPDPGPQIVSEFYLTACFEDTFDIGFTHFIVKNLPNPEYDSVCNVDFGYQYYVDYLTIKKNNNQKINFGDTDDRDMEIAIKNSMSNNNQCENLNNNYYEYQVYNDVDYDDVVKISLKEYFEDLKKNNIPEEPSEECINNNTATNVLLHYNSKYIVRRFRNDDTISKIKSYYKYETKTACDINVSTKLLNNTESSKENFLKDSITVKEVYDDLLKNNMIETNNEINLYIINN